MCDYEAIRLKNIEDNRRILASFTLLDPFKSVPKIIKKNKKCVYKPPELKKKQQSCTTDSYVVGRSRYGTRQWTARMQSVHCEVSYEEVDDDSDGNHLPKVPSSRPKLYGEIAGIDVGTNWATRLECSRDGIHRPTVAGIHGGENGAYSIALSGGYEDDVDLGDCFTYTGEGGRDLKGTKSNPKNLRTAPQSKDQTLTRGNLALSKNVQTRNPVRVIRGYKLSSQFAPDEGYRYDGLYTVEKCWYTTGLSGFGVWKFAFKRTPNQAPLPWQFADDSSFSEKSDIDRSHCANGIEDHMGKRTKIETANCNTTGYHCNSLHLPVVNSETEGLQDIATDCCIAPTKKKICKKM